MKRVLLSLVLVSVLLGISSESFAAWAHVQSRSADTGSTASIALAFTSNVTAGNLIVVAFTYGDSPNDDVTSVTGCGNTYTRVTNGWQVDTGNQQNLLVYYAKNVAAGACTVTAALVASRGFTGIIILEYSGGDTTAPLDKSVGQFDATGSTATDGDVSTAATTTADGELIFGATVATATGATTWAPGTGFTERQETAFGGALGMETEDKVQATAGSVQATWTASDTSNYVAVMATFKLASAGGPPVGQFPRVQ